MIFCGIIHNNILEFTLHIAEQTTKIYATKRNTITMTTKSVSVTCLHWPTCKQM